MTAGDGSPPHRLLIRAAYDIPDGSPLRNWSKFDFEFGRAPIEVTTAGGTLAVEDGNRLEFVPSAAEFELRADGFEAVRDLIVDVRAVETDGEQA